MKDQRGHRHLAGLVMNAPLPRQGTIHPSDEWFCCRPPHPLRQRFTSDYDQLENGVGMLRLFEEEFLAELDKPHRIYGTKELTWSLAPWQPAITRMMGGAAPPVPHDHRARPHHPEPLFR